MRSVHIRVSEQHAFFVIVKQRKSDRKDILRRLATEQDHWVLDPGPGAGGVLPI